MRTILLFTFILFSAFTSPNQNHPPVDHSAWDALLRKYVSASGVVNYKGIRAEKAKLQAYLNKLSAGVPSTNSRTEKMAFWINAYNAFTVKLILDNYPTSSITQLKGGKPWDAKFVKIGSQTYSLNQIEHEILRKQYFDARLHFVLVCAAQSCPKLLNKAYTASNLYAEMDKQARYFINNPSKNKLSASAAQVSKLFDWYKDDFTKKGSLISFINKYSNVKLGSGAKVSYLSYDWALNE